MQHTMRLVFHRLRRDGGNHTSYSPKGDSAWELPTLEGLLKRLLLNKTRRMSKSSHQPWETPLPLGLLDPTAAG